MALEAVVFPQDPFGYGWEEIIYSLGGGPNTYWGYDFGLQEASKAVEANTRTIEQLPSSRENGETSSPSHQGKDWDLDSSPETPNTATGRGGKRRRRTKNAKDKEQVENQRMTHIAVERNRRKQMNDYLAVLRSLMPQSYVQRGDQASIVGGAINFVKELEQQVQSIEAGDQEKKKPPFADFFSFPQYIRHASNSSPSSSSSNKGSVSVGDIEVSMVDSHASVKILCKKQPRQLLKMVAAFQRLSLTVLHLNVTTTQHQMVLYSLSLKVEEGSELNSVDEIAAAVNEMLWRIKEEACACY